MIYLLFFYLQFSIINYNTLKTERGMAMANSIDELLFDITPEILQLAKLCEESNAIEKELYTEYQVKRGLRDVNGKGVLAGLTNISDVCASQIVDGEEVPCEEKLYLMLRIFQNMSLFRKVIRRLTLPSNTMMIPRIQRL